MILCYKTNFEHLKEVWEVNRVECIVNPLFFGTVQFQQVWKKKVRKDKKFSQSSALWTCIDLGYFHSDSLSIFTTNTVHYIELSLITTLIFWLEKYLLTHFQDQKYTYPYTINFRFTFLKPVIDDTTNWVPTKWCHFS